MQKPIVLVGNKVYYSFLIVDLQLYSIIDLQYAWIKVFGARSKFHNATRGGVCSVLLQTVTGEGWESAHLLCDGHFFLDFSSLASTSKLSLNLNAVCVCMGTIQKVRAG